MKFLYRDRGTRCVAFSRRQIGADPGLSSQTGTTPNRDRGANSNLAAHDDVILDDNGARKTDLTTENDIFSNTAVVSNVYVIVELRTSSNPCFSECSSIDSAVSAHTNIVLNDDGSDLGHLRVSPGSDKVPEAIRANDSA